MQHDPALGISVYPGRSQPGRAWKFRYPGDPEEPPAEETAAAFETAREVFYSLMGRMPADIRP